MKRHLALKLTILVFIVGILLPKEALARSLAQDSTPTPAEVIEAVNALRIASGLNPLSTHPALMQVAQWEANAIAGGAAGHTRPAGLTLGKWLISLGYPLAGDLSLDGYRSENWVAANTTEDAIRFWLGDGPHTNTMLSPNRSDIGASVAVSGQTYIVIETALQTGSGQMQSDAETMLGDLSEAHDGSEESSLLPQFIMPVIVSAARPDGDVIHKVQYGQSLWSIAMAYYTTVDQIRAWNNLGDSTSITEGYLLLVQKAATQQAPLTATSLPSATPTYLVAPTFTPTVEIPTISVQPSSTNPVMDESPHSSSPRSWLVILIIMAMVAGIWFALSIPSAD
ncbi:MAG: LysM peptidoglycan-binding domain-containing protein [Anaerolineales bacterium]|uniref:LysM peptidoglycan-binding domain-containing protein n=1 Tax=Candidatus Desulfolinea nitratireducens TaxID=2841698 RepID=A0A8J6TKN6_9CHLR|nr:LysM peptidoglycan-binding domain-containing protein [Candidatus Desulfolinea nitratireducens]